ncbi:acetate--CoA ligase family protein [Alicyclobacillus sp. ALC3]|uniref:acetate--CoA ligase family protein n=1 Tax=Alicyclobacillus sp. ALC3 TaxID=2796143 RepID=UPI002378D9D1|nr:acetate--CoA ligase family protein [Alicyclobacillus sp. ALC3]WDL97628.1 acetate--CoA ligase family protein [Alicyclobacillus sp. ALC3]
MSNQEAAPAIRHLVGVERLLRPKSLAIVGVSSTPGSPGLGVWNNLKNFGCAIETWLVSRSRDEVDGHACVRSVDELPEGIDVAVLCVPASAAVESVTACARRKVGVVVLYGAGYAEAGALGQRIQDEVVSIAEQHGMAVAGPNCMGLTNFVDGVPVTFAPGLQHTPTGHEPGVAILTQSGGMMSNLREMSQAKGVPISYAISTGNEAGLGVEEYLEYLVTDRDTKTVAMYVEQIRNPQRFLALARRARLSNKSIVLLHSGRSAASREAAQSHTGAMVKDVRIAKTLLQAEGVIVVETMEDLVDVAHMLTCFVQLPTAGPGILTDSGALKGFALDYADAIGLELPGLSSATRQRLNEVMPSYTTSSNPLDITAQALSEMSLYTETAAALLHDEAVGSLMVVVLPGSLQIALRKAKGVLLAVDGASKPAVFVIMGEGSPLSEELVPTLRQHHVPLFRSPERAMRAMTAVVQHARWLAELRSREALDDTASGNAKSAGVPGVQVPAQTILVPPSGSLMEHEGKGMLAALGIPTPLGGLCQTADEAVELAKSIGYPLVLKIQAPSILHKSDVGGVIVGIGNEAALRENWRQLMQNVGSACPNVHLDGVLVERMAKPGAEMVVGAKRDSTWGPVLMVGMGGVWIELLHDVRLLQPGLPVELIEREILSLQAAPLLTGTRGSGRMDVRALAVVVEKVGQLICTNPEIAEIDLNPVVVYRAGQGVQVLDAVILGVRLEGRESQAGECKGSSNTCQGGNL